MPLERGPATADPPSSAAISVDPTMSVNSTVTRTVEPRFGDMAASLPRGTEVGNPRDAGRRLLLGLGHGRPACSGSTQALAGFGDPTVIFIAALFVVNEGPRRRGGVTSWAGQQLTARVGASRTLLDRADDAARRAALTALISVNGAVAALGPGDGPYWPSRSGRPPSQLLLPLASGAHAGSLLALTGTPVNVMVSDAAADAGAGPFGFFAFAVAGSRSWRGRSRSSGLVGDRLLPHRRRAITRDFSAHARTLVEQYRSSSQERCHAHAGVAAWSLPPRSDLAGERCSRAWSTTAATSSSSACSATARS